MHEKFNQNMFLFFDHSAKLIKSLHLISLLIQKKERDAGNTGYILLTDLVVIFSKILTKFMLFYLIICH